MVANIDIIFAGLADEKLHIVTTWVLKKFLKKKHFCLTGRIRLQRSDLSQTRFSPQRRTLSVTG